MAGIPSMSLRGACVDRQRWVMVHTLRKQGEEWKETVFLGCLKVRHGHGWRRVEAAGGWVEMQVGTPL